MLYHIDTYFAGTPEETNDLRLAVAEFQRNAQVHPLKQGMVGGALRYLLV
jgi:hypothetical protein